LSKLKLTKSCRAKEGGVEEVSKLHKSCFDYPKAAAVCSSGVSLPVSSLADIQHLMTGSYGTILVVK
jgi:hypothetical protein